MNEIGSLSRISHLGHVRVCNQLTQFNLNLNGMVQTFTLFSGGGKASPRDMLLIQALLPKAWLSLWTLEPAKFQINCLFPQRPEEKQGIPGKHLQRVSNSNSSIYTATSIENTVTSIQYSGEVFSAVWPALTWSNCHRVSAGGQYTSFFQINSLMRSCGYLYALIWSGCSRYNFN